MRKAFVFIASFVAVLVAGAALAFMATPGTDADDVAKEEAIEETTTTSMFHEEEKELPAESEEDTAQPKGEEPKDEEPKEEAKDEPAEHNTPPELVILYPEDGARFTEKHLAFEGEVEPGARVFAGDYEADVTEDGHWRIVLILSDGGNLATITAVDDTGNEAHAQVKVYLDFDDEPKDEPKDYEFTANQKYGSCAEDVPYDVWFGTGEPGTTVWVGNDYGSASTVIGEKGGWDLKVFFPEAPCNTQIAVVLETDEGHRKVYEFIRFCDKDGPADDEPK
jgi:hypothetical protein